MADRYDEQAILAYVEGEMSAAERSAFEQTLTHDDALRQLVTDMVADRNALLALRADAAPPGLVDAAIGHLERRMLLDPDPQADDSTLLAGPIPIRTAAQRRPMARRWFTYAAVAALLVVSGAVMWETLVVPNSPTPRQFADAEGRAKDEALLIAPAAPESLSKTEAALPDARAAGGARASNDAPTPTVADEAAPAPVTVPPEPEPAEPVTTFADAGRPEHYDVAERSLTTLAQPAAPSHEAPAASAPETESLLAPASEPEPEPEPELRVRVASRSNRDAERQVMTWALNNNAQIIRPAAAPTARTRDDDNGLAASKSVTATGAFEEAPKQQAVIVELAEPQVASLVSYLNKDKEQQAFVVDDADRRGTSRMGIELKQDSVAADYAQMEERNEAREDPALNRPYEIDWDKLLRAQVPLADVERAAPPEIATLPARRVRVMLELDEVPETTATEDNPQ